MQWIAWVGALLTDAAAEWHVEREEEMGDWDTWQANSEAIQEEYQDTREADMACEKIDALRYKGDIKAFMTSFRTLNRRAHISGSSLRQRIDAKMTAEILTMRFSQNPRPFVEDEPFLLATYEAGRHVEALQAVLKAQGKQGGGGTGSSGGNKDAQGSGKGSGKTERSGRSGKREVDHKQTQGSGSGGQSEKDRNGRDRWSSKKNAFRGVPSGEIEKHRLDPQNCERCGRPGHQTEYCYARKTVGGTELPPAPWHPETRASGATSNKRKRGSDDAPSGRTPAPKQAKTSAVQVTDTDMREAPVWAAEPDSEEDF